MADPISILGTAGAVANIIDVLGKSIRTIAELRNQWQDADLTVVVLESQLAALNAALGKIKDWAESSFDSPHHQLAMDLDRCVACCRLLILKIDVEISRFTMDANDRLDIGSKFRLLFKTKDFENVQRMIEQQTAALTLLLTACNTTILSEQKRYLEEPQTRKAFKKMEEDTASLVVHRDVDSLMTSNTAMSISSSKRSVIFEFDSELFISKIYQRWIRGSVKKSLQVQQGDTASNDVATKLRENTSSWRPLPIPTPRIVISSTGELKRSRLIDRYLKEDMKRLRGEYEILLAGDASRHEVAKQMEIAHGKQHSTEELHDCRPMVLKSACTLAKSTVATMRKFGVSESDDICQAVKFIEDYALDPVCPEFDSGFVTALKSILKSHLYTTAMGRQAELSLSEPAAYFFDEIDRIASPDYVPNEMDVLQSRTRTTGINETRLQMGELRISMFDIGEQRSHRNKWLHYVDSVSAMIFVVDLDTYDQVSLEESSQTRMMESLLLFESTVNSIWFRGAGIILFLNKVDILRQKLDRFLLRITSRITAAGMTWMRR